MRIAVPRIFGGYRDQVQAPDRVDNIDLMVADLKTGLALGQLTVLEPVIRHAPEHTEVSIRGGAKIHASLAQDLMIRLELMSKIDKDTFQEIVSFAHNGDYQISDWYKINSEVYRLGVTSDSAASEAFEKTSFFEGFVEGFGAIFTFGQSISETARRRAQSPPRTIERLDFTFHEFVQSLVVAASEWDGQCYRLVNPMV